MSSFKKHFAFVLLCIGLASSVVLFRSKQAVSDEASSAVAVPQPAAQAPRSLLHASTKASVVSVPSQPQADERFPGSVILESRDEQIGGGRIQRVQLVRTQMKYPFLRVERLIEIDPITGVENQLTRREMVADHVVVELTKESNEAELLNAIASVGGTIRKKLRLSYSSSYIVALPQPTIDGVIDASETLSKFKNIFNFAEPDFLSHKASVPNDPQLSAQWHLNNEGQVGGTADADIDAPEAWSTQTGNDNVLIAITDTGMDYRHQDLQANVWTNPNEITDGSDNDHNGYVDDVHGWNFAYGTGDPDDDEGHGTFVAGVIGARGDNGVGVSGVLWRCKMMALKVLDNTGSGYNSDIAEAYDYARVRGVKIINSSHAGPSSTLLVASVSALDAAGVLLAAAADNDARNEDAWQDFPASFTNQNVVAVGASDKNDGIAYFSNWGARTVDLFAPGDEIWSTQPGNGYGTDSGTSFATPQVAAAAGLVKAQNPTWTTAEIKAALLNSVDILPAFPGKCVSGGRLNANRAVLGNYNIDSGMVDYRFTPKWNVAAGSSGVLALAVYPGNRVIAGGTFTSSTIHRIARFKSDGSLDGTFTPGSGANGDVTSVAVQPDGKIVIAGNFTAYNGNARARVARLNANGTVDGTFGSPAVNARVNAMLLAPDGKLIIAGDFTTVAGVSVPNIARLNANGKLDSSFNSPAVVAVDCLAFQSNGKIIYAGASIGRLNSDGTVDSSFNPGSGPNGTVRCLTVDSSGDILIGGDFTTYNGSAAPHIARLQPTGVLDSSFQPGTGPNGAGATITSIVVNDDCTLLVGGTFTDFNNEQLHSNARRGVVRLTNTGSVDPNFQTGSGSSPGPNTIAQLTDGRAYIGGAFTSYNDFPRRFVARIATRDLTLGTNVYTVSITNLTFPSTGGNGDVGVSTTGCASWRTFVSSNDWLTFSSGVIGVGAGDVTFAVASNTNALSRSVTLNVAGTNINVTQQGAFAVANGAGKTIVFNDLVFTTSLSNTFVFTIADITNSGTFTYTMADPVTGVFVINDSDGTATITLSFTSGTTGTYTNSRGSSGTFTIYFTRPDYNGDNRSDLLWANSTNALRAWFMDGTNVFGVNRVAAAKKQGTGWKVVGEYDFDHNGSPDILWQNTLNALSIWLLNGTNFERSISFGTAAGKVIGLADLNADGQKDLITETGAGILNCVFLNGTNRLRQIRLNYGKAVPLSLKAVGFDDFNGDGEPDLVWQNSSNVLSVWSMQGTNIVSTNVFNGGQSIGTDVKVVALNDFNYDGHPDILFEDTAGNLWLWLLNGTDVVDVILINPAEAVDPKWRVVGPK